MKKIGKDNSAVKIVIRNVLAIFVVIFGLSLAGVNGQNVYAASRAPGKVKGITVVHRAKKKTLTLKWNRPKRGATFEVKITWQKSGKPSSILTMSTGKRRVDTIKYKLGYTLKAQVRAKNKDGVYGRWSKTVKYKCTRANRRKNYHLSKDKMNDYQAESNEMSNKILEYVNKDREKLGLKPLKMLKGLNLVAKKRAKEIASSYNHNRPNGQSIWALFEKYNVDTLDGYGENIMRGVDSAKDFYKAWYNSEGHYNNMMSTKYNAVGIYVYTDKNGKMHAVQIFSKK